MTRAQRIAAATAIATAVAIPAEGLRQWAYSDPAGVLTVCYGSTGNVEARQYTLAECRELLDAAMLRAVTIADTCAPGLPDKTLAAFGDLVYNVGPVPVCDRARSTLARLLAAGDVRGACEELPRWSKARVAGTLVTLPGLVKRRERERQLCLEGIGEMG